MPGKLFVNYRRDDARDMAARIRDRLAATFGEASVFMDVDNLLAGQRFDKELEKALNETDVFLTVIGPRWLELLAERHGSGERDYVREEIAGALQRGIVVIPLLIELTPLPRAAELPEDIRELVLHHTHEVAHARFGRDVVDLIEAIRSVRKPARAEAVHRNRSIRWVRAVTLMALVLGGAGLVLQEAERQWRAKVVADSQRFKIPEVTPEEEARWLQEDERKRAEAAKHPEVAKLRKGMPYAEARPILLGGGWQPFKQPPDHVCGVIREICNLYVETVSCGGKFVACRFEWTEANGKKLVVITSGESNEPGETWVAHWYLE